MKNNSGFTLIELIIVLSIVMILGSLLYGAFFGDEHSGVVCIDGYKYTQDFDDGDLKQMINSKGAGIECQ